MHNRDLRLHVPALAVVLALATTVLPLTPGVHAAELIHEGLRGHEIVSKPRVIPPGSTPLGKSYAEWGAEWWKWALSIPLAQNPMNDQTGVNGSSGQSGPVWYLAGTFCVDLAACNLATATRTCSVPAGKMLFIPILNAECSTFEGNGTTEAELRACAQGAIDLAANLLCEIDGVPVENLGAYRATSGLFTWGPLPDGNIFGGPAGTTSPAVSDGYFLMIAPMPVGKHTIHFTGAFAEFFALDVTYNLTVKGGADPVDVASMRAAGYPVPGERTTWGRLKLTYR